MDDFDFDFDWDAPGDLYDISSLLDDIDWNSIDFGVDENFDVGSLLGDIDWNADDFGVDETFPGADTGLEDIVITGERPTDLSGFDLSTADEVYQGTDTRTGFDFDTSDQVYQGSNLGVDEEDLKDKFWKDLITGEDEGAGTVVITGTRPTDEDEPCKPGSETVQKFRDGSTLTLDCKGRVIGSTPATTDEPPDDTDPPCEPGTETTKTYENGATITFDCKGRVISSTGPTVTPDTKCPPNSNTLETLPDGTKIVKDCKGNVLSVTKPTGTTTTPPGTDDWSKWAALLGGILGLLGRKTDTPASYRGTIPKYTATRGPARSPTEGGRRPGGANIGSLTGGVTYTPVGAAYGGLMGLAAGGKPRTARYLRGGTDGMADKIQTDIDGKQPARLSHGEFVIPADVVSHLGNGNSEAGADVLYDMMSKVRKARTGTPQQGKQINPRKYLPK